MRMTAKKALTLDTVCVILLMCCVLTGNKWSGVAAIAFLLVNSILINLMINKITENMEKLVALDQLNTSTIERTRNASPNCNCNREFDD